jgi:hypothetical protein
LNEKKRKLPHSAGNLTLSVCALYLSARSAFVGREALTFDDQVKLLAKLSAEVLHTHFGAQCEPCIRVCDERPFVDGAHRCEAEIEFLQLQHAPHVATLLVAIVIARYGDDIGSSAAKLHLQVAAATADSRHLGWRTLAAPVVQPPPEQSVIGASPTACAWLEHQGLPKLPATVAPSSGITSVIDIPIMSFLVPQGRPSLTGERLAPLSNYAEHLTLNALIGALTPAVLDKVTVERHIYTNTERDINIALQPSPNINDDRSKHVLFMAAPCGSGKTQAFLKLLGTLPRDLVRVLALQIRCSLVSQLYTQLVGRSVTPVLYNNGDVSAKCDDDNDDDSDSDNTPASLKKGKESANAPAPKNIAIGAVMPKAVAQFTSTPEPSAFISTIHSAHLLQRSPPFTVLQLDEVRALIEEAFRDTNSTEKIQRTVSVLIEAMATTPLTVMADAYMGLETSLLAVAAVADYSARCVVPEQLVVHEHVVDYTFAGRTAGQQRGTVTELPPNELEHKLIELVRGGSRVWVYCDSLTQLLTLREMVRREVPGIVDVELHGKVSAHEKATLMANLTTELERRCASVVFATSTASIGVSIVGYFDVVCAFFSGRMPANEALQALYRERAPRQHRTYIAWPHHAAAVRKLPLPLRTVGDVVRAHANSTQRRLVAPGGVLSMLESVQLESRRLSIAFARPLTLQLLRDDGFDVIECALAGKAVSSPSTPADAMRATAQSIEATVTNNVAGQSFRFADPATTSRVVAANIVAYERQLDALEALVQVAFANNTHGHNDHVRFARIVHNLALIVHPGPEYKLGLFGGERELDWSNGAERNCNDTPWLTHPVQTDMLLTTDQFLSWLRTGNGKQVVQTLYGRDAVRSVHKATPLSLLRSLTNRLFGDTCLGAEQKNKGPTIAWPKCARALDLLVRQSSRQLPKAFKEWCNTNAHATCSWRAELRAEAQFNEERQPTAGDTGDAVERCIELLKAHTQFLPHSIARKLKQADAESNNPPALVKRPRRAGTQAASGAAEQTNKANHNDE